VLKPLGKLYRNQEMVSGASILGDGTIALVLDTSKIIKLCSNQENYSHSYQ
jgi:two-component system chemotaxis sensor kinase CheA